MARNSGKSGAPDSPAAGSAPAIATVRQATDALVRRIPPYNEEAEQAVLAGLLHYADDLADDIFATVQTDDFYVPRHGLIFQACYELRQAKAPIAPQTLSEKLHSRNRLEEAGGMEYISILYGQEVLGTSALFYATMVRNKSMQRRLINTCADILSTTYDTPYDQVETLLDRAEHAIFSIAEQATSTNSLVLVRELRDAFFDTLDRAAKNRGAPTGITTGYPDLNEKTGGFQPSDLIILAARPSMGKTAFSLNLALNAAAAGNKVAFFSLEMSAGQLVARLMSITSKVPLSKIRQPRFLTDDDWQALYNVGAPKLEAELFIDDTPALRTLDLRAKARRLKARSGLDLIIVDYLQLMRPSRPMSSRELEISEISRTLKALAKELNIPVIALSQLNRKLEERPDKRPVLSDLRESGAIEQDADVILFLYRDDVYAKPKKGPDGEIEPPKRLDDSPTEVIIGKQRNGPVGTVKLLYKCAYTSFEDLSPMEESQVSYPSENGILL